MFNNFLDNLTPLYILSQCFALISVLLFVGSYLTKRRLLLLIFQTVGNICAFLSILCLGDLVGGIGTAIATIRAGVFSLYSKKEKEIPWWLVIFFILLTFAATLFGDFEPWTLFYLVGLSVFTIALKMQDLLKLKIGLLIATIIYILYYFMMKNYIGCIGKVIELISLIVGILIVMKDRKKEER